MSGIFSSSLVVGIVYTHAGGLGCHLDRHENIGRGKLGMSTFRRIMNDPFFNDLPMILETPEGDYRREVQSLYKLIEK